MHFRHYLLLLKQQRSIFNEGTHICNYIESY